MKTQDKPWESLELLGVGQRPRGDLKTNMLSIGISAEMKQITEGTVSGGMKWPWLGLIWDPNRG